MKFNQAQINYVTGKYISDSRVRNGVNLIETIKSTHYGQNALIKARQRTQTRFDHYMIDVVGSRVAKNTEIPPITRYRLMIERYFDKYIFQIKEEDIAKVLNQFGFGERQTRMDLIDALNPEVELSEDAMLSENDMDDIIMAISVVLYAIFNVVDISYSYTANTPNQPQYADSRLCAFA